MSEQKRLPISNLWYMQIGSAWTARLQAQQKERRSTQAPLRSTVLMAPLRWLSKVMRRRNSIDSET